MPHDMHEPLRTRNIAEQTPHVMRRSIVDRRRSGRARAIVIAPGVTATVVVWRS